MRIERIEWDGRDAAEMARALRDDRPDQEEVSGAVAEIVHEVAERGDGAVRELTRRFDGVELGPGSARVDPATLRRAADDVPADVRAAMELAAANVRTVAEAELAATFPVDVALAEGQRVQLVDSPVGAAGVYVPGGRAAYPSSVLMCCIPARAAGVGRVAVATPPGADGSVHPTVLAACAVAGIDELYAIGGAQAIAALALGTESVPAVDLIAGPGNRYVVEAKRLLSTHVGIDGIAGPTELVVVADGSADPEWVALDVCAQAEHGTDGLLVVIGPDGELLERTAELLPELALARTSVSESLVSIVTAPGVEAALALADALAPEHVELQLDGADEEAARARVAGCVFVGAHGGAAFGDYAAGSSHVLPTGGAARFGRPLGARAFMRRTSIVSIPPSAAAALAPATAALARAEGFPVHGESARARAGQNGGEP
ncbi:MAG TPA: histidinol dehydrogenase [Solirubrobacterales bacterium]|nr:histidinol dehydrogenase [Solirubrobacterales bacterium]